MSNMPRSPNEESEGGGESSRNSYPRSRIGDTPPQFSERSTEATFRPRQDSERHTRGPQSSYQYGKIQAEGEQRRLWLEDPNEPNCYISRSTLTIEDLRTDYGLACTPSLTDLQSILMYHSLELDPTEMSASGARELSFRAFRIMHENFVWVGHIGPGIITLDGIQREEKSDAPHISEITQALYQNNFAMDNLKYGFVTSVENPETLSFIMFQLYNELNTGLSWPDYHPRAWKFGSPQYDALLGTRLGKVVAYFVLGAFHRGTRRIQSIVTWTGDTGMRANLRFDISAI